MSFRNMRYSNRLYSQQRIWLLLSTSPQSSSRLSLETQKTPASLSRWLCLFQTLTSGLFLSLCPLSNFYNPIMSNTGMNTVSPAFNQVPIDSPPRYSTILSNSNSYPLEYSSHVSARPRSHNSSHEKWQDPSSRHKRYYLKIAPDPLAVLHSKSTGPRLRPCFQFSLSKLHFFRLDITEMGKQG